MLIDNAIKDKLTKYTIDNSSFECKRKYISLSHIWLPEDELISQYKIGFNGDNKSKLKCYKGYQMQQDLILRLINIYNDKISTGIEISLYDGLIQGHPDCTFMEAPCDIKSELMDEWIFKKRLPIKTYWQMQAYMKYLGQDEALVIYESRESGIIMPYWIYDNDQIQQQIDDKIKRIVKRIKETKCQNVPPTPR